jgi:RNA polymerase sigma-70 factor (ECF subfamily)
MTHPSAKALAAPPDGASPAAAKPPRPAAANPTRNEELLALLERDREHGARLLFRTFSADVNRLVWRLLGADPDHSDVVQQAFFKVLSRWQTVREPERLGSWIQTIVVNTVFEELRRREFKRVLMQAWRPARLHGDLVREVEARDFLVAAMTVLRRLPAEERIVFSLRYVEGKTVPQIAELCGTSTGTVKRRLRRASERFERLTQRYPELARWSRSQQSSNGGEAR